MISDDFQITQVDPDQLLNLGLVVLEHVKPRTAPATPAQGPTGAVVLVYDRYQCLLALKNGVGALTGFDPGPTPDLAAVAEQQGVPRVIQIEREVFTRIRLTIETELKTPRNLYDRIMLLYDAVRDELGRGVKVHPPVKLPPLNAEWIRRIARLLIPAGRLALVTVYSDDGRLRDGKGRPIAASLIPRTNQAGELDLVTTTDSLADLTVESLADPRALTAAAHQKWGAEPYVGLHLPQSVVGTLMNTRTNLTGLILDLNQSGRLVIDPFPWKLKLALKAGDLFKI